MVCLIIWTKNINVYKTEVWNICSEYENESWLLNMIKAEKNVHRNN